MLARWRASRRGELGEGAGLVEQVDAQEDHAAVLDEAALDDAGEEGDVDVAAADEDAGFDAGALGEGGFALQEGGEGGGAGAFGEGLFALEQEEDGGGDFVFVNGDDFVDVLCDDGVGDGRRRVGRRCRRRWWCRARP